MFLIWILLLVLFPLNVCSYSTKARLAEWNLEQKSDEVGDILLILVQGNTISNTVNNDSLQLHLRKKRLAVSFDDADTRTGFKVEAVPFIEKFKRTPSLGDCTLGNHRYKGEEIYTPFPRITYKYIRTSNRIKTHEYSDIMGGVGISFMGLFGASAKARVISTVKRDKKSLTIYSHFTVHKGMISLGNSKVGSNWQSCTKLGKHHYLRDILTGMDDYLMVQLKFRSESKRREIEIKIKVKLLFVSITKTIRKIKTDFSSDFSVSVYRVRTFPTRTEERLRFGTVDGGINYIESLENGRIQVLKDIQAAKYNDHRLHLEYFFQPCMIKTIVDSLPFKPASSFLLIELVERTNEMESVLQDIKNIKLKATGKEKSKLESLEKEIMKRLQQIGNWKKEKLSHSNVGRLLALYGPNRAPYYYERELNRILKH